MKIYDYHGRKNMCGERVREARLKQRMSQTDLSARLQCNGVILERDFISRIDTGTRFVADYELFTLARVLRVTLDWLAGEPDTTN